MSGCVLYWLAADPGCAWCPVDLVVTGPGDTALAPGNRPSMPRFCSRPCGAWVAIVPGQGMGGIGCRRMILARIWDSRFPGPANGTPGSPPAYRNLDGVLLIVVDLSAIGHQAASGFFDVEDRRSADRTGRRDPSGRRCSSMPARPTRSTPRCPRTDPRIAHCDPGAAGRTTLFPVRRQPAGRGACATARRMLRRCTDPGVGRCADQRWRRA